MAPSSTMVLSDMFCARTFAVCTMVSVPWVMMMRFPLCVRQCWSIFCLSLLSISRLSFNMIVSKVIAISVRP